MENQRQQRDAYNEMPVTAGKGFSGGRIRTGHALCRGQCFWEAPFACKNFYLKSIDSYVT